MIGSKLPHQSEPIEKLRDRWHDAVSFAVEAEKCKADPDNAYIPSQHRRHVFDFDDGLRLVVSRDRVAERQCLHVSASGTDKFLKKYQGRPKAAALRIAGAVQLIGGAAVANPPGHENHRATGVIDFLCDL